MQDATRRRFLKVSLVGGGALLLGFTLAYRDAAGPAERFRREAGERGALAPGAWLRLDPDGTVTVRVASAEMGQGVATAIPMLVAEELEVDFTQVRAEFAPADPAYRNPLLGQQMTGGSSAIRAFWRPLREAGATARSLLVSAAALRWQVPEAECSALAGQVRHGASGRALRYGELLAEAAALPPPERVQLKEPEEFVLIGTPQPPLDALPKLTGRATYAQDFHRPGMLTALLARPPLPGATLRHFDAPAARAIPGVREVIPLEAGVAVLAEGFWPALKGREALAVEWQGGPEAGLDSGRIRERLAAALAGGVVARREGVPEAVLRQAPQVIEAIYEVPFLAHACMEPLSCAAEVSAERCDIWVGTQAQTRTQQIAMELTGLPRERVHVHTLFLGGGFGRRGEGDFVREAVALARACGRPVKVLWTREDDLRHDFYRPATLNRLRAAIDRNGRPLAWTHRIAGPSIQARVWPKGVKGGLDRSSLEGAADLPYAIPNLEITYAMVNTPVPVGYWRSVGHSQNAFITESFFDEVAAAAGRDPLALRRELLADRPRQRAVLDLAAQKGQWGAPLPPGRARGVAFSECFGSRVAQVAEVSLADGGVRVHRVVCAVDCGQVVNPDSVAAQMEGGIVFGLTAALKGAITLREGRIEQSNFHDYPLLRYDEMPSIEVHLLPSRDPPGGAGEPGTPPSAPSVANALFALTGRPVRRLPIQLG